MVKDCFGTSPIQGSQHLFVQRFDLLVLKRFLALREFLGRYLASLPLSLVFSSMVRGLVFVPLSLERSCLI